MLKESDLRPQKQTRTSDKLCLTLVSRVDAGAGEDTEALDSGLALAGALDGVMVATDNAAKGTAIDAAAAADALADTRTGVSVGADSMDDAIEGATAVALTRVRAFAVAGTTETGSAAGDTTASVKVRAGGSPAADTAADDTAVEAGASDGEGSGDPACALFEALAAEVRTAGDAGEDGVNAAVRPGLATFVGAIAADESAGATEVPSGTGAGRAVSSLSAAG